MRIAVALSGGVDSTAVAWKLKSAGHEVVGLTMRLCPEWPSPRSFGRGTRSDSSFVEGAVQGLPEHGCRHCVAPCACQESVQAARQLGIRHEILDWRQAFEKNVITPFVQAFAGGLTPNPCALCNRTMKFGMLLDYAREIGAEALATGHYIRNAEKGVRRGADPAKDQSYFVSRVPKDRFQHVVFPLGGETKQEVQSRVAASGLRPEAGETSTEICFLQDRDYVDFLRYRVPDAFRPGEIVDQAGRVLGRHQGLPAYTIGQRKGLGIAAPHPLYVLRLDPEKNQVVVGPDQALASATAHLAEMNWFDAVPEAAIEVQAQVRYRQSPVPARLEKTGPDTARLRFERPIRAVTPGQVAAVYLGDSLLGGGVIVSGGDAP